MNRTDKKRMMREKRRNCRGVAAVEFALMLSIWTTLLLGVIDGSYYLLVNERVDRIAYSVTDIVAQHQKITLANLNDLMLGAMQLMEPLSFNPATLGTPDGEGNYPAATLYYRDVRVSGSCGWNRRQMAICLSAVGKRRFGSVEPRRGFGA